MFKGDDYIKVHAYLKQANVLTKLEDGHVEYKQGFSDETIAKNLGTKPTFVAKIRAKYFGSFKHNTGFAPATNVNALRKEMQILAKDINNALANIEAQLEAVIKWARQRGMDAPNGRMNIVKDFKEMNK